MKENRTRIISLEKSKAMKRVKELKEKQAKESNSKKKPQNESTVIKDQKTDLSLNLSNPSDGYNPFAEDSYQDSNPFLNSPVDSAYSDSNPFGGGGKLTSQ